LAKCI